MANGRFVGDPEVLIPKGNEMKSLGSEFNEEIVKVYDTIEQITASEYISPEAKKIKEESDKCRVHLEEMAKTISEYGQFSENAGNKIIKNQNGIIDSVTGGQEV